MSERQKIFSKKGVNGRMNIDNSFRLAEIENIVTRLQYMSSQQKLIEQSYSGYAEWYKVAPEGLPHPNNVQINFRLQTLYFQPGAMVHLPAYITTTMELNVLQEDFGIYSLFTNLDGSYRDDVMIWASATIYTPWKDYGTTKPIEPIELRNVPVEMQDIFPKLVNLSREQQLIDRASTYCSTWFKKHHDWYQRYPMSLAEEGIKKGLEWFRKYPLWYQQYPKGLFKTSEVRIDVEKQVLCFNHMKYMYPHIKTYLNIYSGGYEIGSFCLVTNVDGTVDEDLSMIVPYPFKTEI